MGCSGLQTIEYKENKYSEKTTNPYVVYKDFHCTFFSNHMVKDDHEIIYNFFAGFPQNNNIIYARYNGMDSVGGVYYQWKVEHDTLYIGITWLIMHTYNEMYTEWYNFEVLKQIINCYKIYYIIKGDKE
jgi:hypothetical protein